MDAVSDTCHGVGYYLLQSGLHHFYGLSGYTGRMDLCVHVYIYAHIRWRYLSEPFLVIPEIFVEKALSMMQKWYAAIIIQNSAASGKATEFNKKILKHSTLIASIKMPIDLFVGKSNVQTYIYVFRVGEAHQNDDTVKFIDFSYDGYTRTNRRKASSNLKDTDNAKERYQEVVDLVRFGREKLKLLSEKEYYEWHIDVESGNDWNQTAPIDTRPELKDFRKTISEYLAWEVTNLLKKEKMEDDCLGK